MARKAISQPNLKPTKPTIAIDPMVSREWMIVGVLTVIGALVRFQGFGHLGLTHFDEGIYAFSGLWAVTPNGLDPQVVAYAPPGFPILVGLSYTIFGVADFSAILASIACGVLTIPTVAWVGRRTFGAGAGAATASFAALSLPHIAFSRKALTDSPFLLCWLFAFGIGGWFLEKPRLGRAVLLGLCVGLAENFKYNGWIAGVIVALAGIFGLFAAGSNRNRRYVVETFGFGLVAALVSVLCYYPWFAYVERHGGYASLLQHQRSYLGPSGTWLTYLRQQLAQMIALSGGIGWGLLTWTVAWLVVALIVFNKVVWLSMSRWNRARLRVVWLIGLTVTVAVPDLSWWAGLAWVGWLALDPRPTYRMLASLWLILSVMTPFYHPYARLWLPLHAAGWLLLAGVIVHLGPYSQTLLSRWETVRTLPRTLMARMAIASVVVILAVSHWGSQGPRALPLKRFFAPTDDLRDIAARINIHPDLVRNRELVLRVLAGRPLYFYLVLNGANPLRLLEDGSSVLDGPGTAGDLMVWDTLQPLGVSSDQANGINVFSQWQFNRPWSVRLDPVTLLDHAPESVFMDYPMEDSSVTLLRPITSRTLNNLPIADPFP